MPSWSADGQWIYFIETVEQRGLFPAQGAARYYTLTYPVLTRIHRDGTGRQALFSGLYKAGGGQYQWFYWMRQPVVSPDGKTVALVTDGPDPTRSDVVLGFIDLKTGKLTKAPVGENAPLGHQDVAWRPDGKLLLYVKNARDGSRGAPSIWQYNLATQRTSALDGARVHEPGILPGRQVGRSHPHQHLRDRCRHPQRQDRIRGPSCHEHEPGMGTGLVAQRGLDRLSHHPLPDRRPATDAPQGPGRCVDARRRAGADPVQRPRRLISSGLVRSAGAAAGAHRNAVGEQLRRAGIRSRVGKSFRHTVSATAWLDLLAARSGALNTVLCLGLDPDPAQLPSGFAPTVRGIERFAALVLEAALPHVAAVKPNLAFYEAFGSAGIRALRAAPLADPDGRARAH